MAKPKCFGVSFNAPESIQLSMRRLPDYLWRKDEKQAELKKIKVKHVWNFVRYAIIVYMLTFGYAEISEAKQQYVGYVVREGVLRSYDARVCHNAEVTQPIGRAVTVVPELNMVLAAYPNGLKMKLVHEGDVRARLQKHVKKMTGIPATQAEIVAGAVEKLRYVQEDRFTVRCRFLARDPKVGFKPKLSLISKQFGNAAKAGQLFRSLKSLKRAFAGGLRKNNDAVFTGTFPARIPQALGFLPQQQAVLIEELRGTHFKEAQPTRDLESSMNGAGAVLANFHKPDKRVCKRVTRRDELKEVSYTFALTKSELPHWRRRFSRFYRRFQRMDWKDGTPAGLFQVASRLNLIFAQNDDFVLRGLDGLRVGHTAYDTANFLFSLYYLETQEHLSGNVRQAIQKLFFQGDAQHAAYAIQPGPVLWFLSSLTINKKASKYRTHALADRAGRVESMPALSEHQRDLCDYPSIKTLTDLSVVLGELPAA